MGERHEFVLTDLPTPPGLNGSYKIVTQYDPRKRRQYHTLALTDAANLWKGRVADALLYEMARQGFKPQHDIRVDRKGEFRSVPQREDAWFVSVYYRLVTSRADADAPVKLLIDAAIQHAIGIDDVWIAPPVGSKFFAEKRGAVSTRGNKLVERSYMHVVILLERIADKAAFNEHALDREMDLLSLLGVSVALPQDGRPEPTSLARVP